MMVPLNYDKDDAKSIDSNKKGAVAWMGTQTSFPSFDVSNNHLNHQQ